MRERGAYEKSNLNHKSSLTLFAEFGRRWRFLRGDAVLRDDIRVEAMTQVAVEADVYGFEQERSPTIPGDTRRHLGRTLRAVYESSLDTQPIPDAQVDLLLRLRHREREMRRAG